MPTARALLLMPLLALLAGCSATYFRAINVQARADGGEQTQVYDVEHRLALDVYRPRDAGRAAPIVVFFYGGAWQEGRRDWYAFAGRALAREGMVAVVPDYRVYPEVRYPVFVEDAARAVAFARAHARDWGGDPERIFLAGHSAGAHIAALLATDARYLAAEAMKPRDLAGVIGIAGPYDFLPLVDRKLQAVFGARDTWPDSQPVNHVDGDEPPFLILHGDRDRRVWPRNGTSLLARLEAANEPARLILYPGIGHVKILSALRFPSLAPTLRDLVAFVREQDARLN